MKLSPVQFGLALGGAFAVLYAACAVILSLVSQDAAMRIFNAFLHGVDVSPSCARTFR